MQEVIKPIGGYFEWELPMKQYKFPNDNGVLVNSGHGALQLIVKHLGEVSNVWVPYYTCDSVTEALATIGVSYKFYHIGYDLKIIDIPQLEENDYLIYTNYLGIMDDYVAILAKELGNRLIVDNAQALYAKPFGNCHQIYSPRKFVGVPDGGIAISPVFTNSVVLPVGYSYDTCSHLLKRLEGKVSEGYADFKKSNTDLRKAPLTSMSRLTRNLLKSVNFESIKAKRMENFMYLHNRLGKSNQLEYLKQYPWEGTFECPMVYPYYTEDVTLRARLIKEQVFVAQYWPNVLNWCSATDAEYALCLHIIPLPIDSRYGEKEMRRIVSIISKE